MAKKPRSDFWPEEAQELLRQLWNNNFDKPYIRAEIKAKTGIEYSLSAIAGKAARMDLERRPMNWKSGAHKYRSIKITLARKA